MRLLLNEEPDIFNKLVEPKAEIKDKVAGNCSLFHCSVFVVSVTVRTFMRLTCFSPAGCTGITLNLQLCAFAYLRDGFVLTYNKLGLFTLEK